MTTHAAIAYKDTNGMFHGITCHNDGYPDYTGALLLKYYTTPFKVKRLIRLGDIIQVGVNVGIRHPGFGLTEYLDEIMMSGKNPAKYCQAMHRDMGEKTINIKHSRNLEDFFSAMHYGYVFDNGIWLCWNLDKRVAVPTQLTDSIWLKKTV